MSYREWLLRYTARRDRVGDLARDASVDDCWKGDGPLSLYRHIDKEHGGWEAALETVCISWAEWKAARS